MHSTLRLCLSFATTRVLGLFLLLGAVCSGPASAAGQHSVNGQKIVRLATGWGAEGFYVGTTGTLPTGADCGAGNTFILANDNPLRKEIVAMLLSAAQSKRPVDLFVDGCTNGSMTLKAVAFVVD